MQVGAIGNVIFSVSSSKVFTWHQASRSVKARFARHEVFNRTPMLEFTGPDTDTFSVSIKLDANLGIDPNQQLSRLEQIVKSGNEQMVILGGRVLGWHVIDSAEETFRRTDGLGKLILAEMSLNLTEYSRVEPYSNLNNNTSNLVISELERQAGELAEAITGSELSASFMVATSAAESSLATAMDVSGGVVAAVEGRVSTAFGFVADATSTAASAMSAIMTPTNIALGAMQNALDTVETAIPLGAIRNVTGLDISMPAVVGAIAGKVSALNDVSRITQQVFSLVSGGVGATRTALARSVEGSEPDTLAGIVNSMEGGNG